MERFNLGYSVNNIPLPTERQYKIQLIEKIEAVIKRMRWKAHYFDTQEKGGKENILFDTRGLKSDKCPAPKKELKDFEKDLFDLVKKVKFRKTTDEFQRKMKKDIKEIKSSTTTLTQADKTTNMYKLSKDKYNQLITNSITTTYKKTNEAKTVKINEEGKKIAGRTGILNRLYVNGTDECFITLKDHKPNFQNKLQTRLINPAKNELGRLSKTIVTRWNKQLKNISNLEQWHDTNTVIEWFKRIKGKSACVFMIFDIKDFYPSISEELLKKSINFAKTHIPIDDEDYNIVMHSRQSLLYNKGKPWIKKSNENFDVSMGAYDGAEICELVGLYLLSTIAKSYDKTDIGLYRDDGLAIFRRISGSKADRIRKHFQAIFKKHGLEVEIECNLKTVNFLDITLDLNNGSYKPYRKPNSETLYIHAKSNHPPNIIKQLPLSVETRLSKLSSDEQIFNEASKHYQETINKCGYNHKLTFTKSSNTAAAPDKVRKRKIIWFNPPFSKNVSTNLGRLFLNLVNKHFHKEHRYSKIFNKNTLKLSYSCMPNVKSIINSHNRKILRQEEDQQKKLCNCLKKTECPLQNQCLSTNIIYEAKLAPNSNQTDERTYIGLTEGTFKKRYANHKKSFHHHKYKSDTELAKEFWKLKDNNQNPTITWSTKYRLHPTSNLSRCNLCLNEKLEILEYKGTNLLNTRDELVSKCRHRNKYKLVNYSPIT